MKSKPPKKPVKGQYSPSPPLPPLKTFGVSDPKNPKPQPPLASAAYKKPSMFSLLGSGLTYLLFRR